MKTNVKTWIIAGLAGSALFHTGCGKKEQGEGGPGGGGGFSIAVETAKVEQKTWPLIVEAVGNLAADEQVLLRNPVAGFVESIEATEGDPVNKGDLLLTIEEETYQLEVRRAEAQNRDAEANLKRKKPLFDQELISESELIDAEAQAQTAEAELGLARKKLRDARITAPFDGKLGRRYVSVGDYAPVNSPLFDLVKIDELELEFSVPSRYLPRLAVGQTVTVNSPAFEDKTFEGTVDFIDPVIDANTRSVRVRARIPNPGERLLPNMFVNVLVNVGEIQDALVFPEQAVVTTLGGTAVFIVENGMALRREITIAERGSGVAVIRDGLPPDAEVVTAGHQKLRDQTPVSTGSQEQ